MDSLIGLYKTECIRTSVFHDGPCKTPRRARVRYRRLVQQQAPARHPRNGAPAEFEQAHYAAVTTVEQPV